MRAAVLTFTYHYSIPYIRHKLRKILTFIKLVKGPALIISCLEKMANVEVGLFCCRLFSNSVNFSVTVAF